MRCTAQRLPSKKSMASDLKSPYVNSNTGHMFGEMDASLNVKLSTNSNMLSNKSTDRVSAGQWDHRRRVLTDQLVLQREMDDGYNHFLHLSQNILIGVYRGHDLRMRFRVKRQSRYPAQ